MDTSLCLCSKNNLLYLESLVSNGSFSLEICNLLYKVIEENKNIIVLGKCGTGKSTLVKCLNNSRGTATGVYLKTYDILELLSDVKSGDIVVSLDIYPDSSKHISSIKEITGTTETEVICNTLAVYNFKDNNYIISNQEEFIYYTFQGDFTLETLELLGVYYSTRENNYYLIDLVKGKFKSDGVVYYFKVSKKYTGDLPTSGLGKHLIKLNGNTLSENRIEFTGNKFNKALMLCDCICRSVFCNNTEDGVRLPITDLLPRMEEFLGIDFDFFKKFGEGESLVYVGLIDEIKDADILEVTRDYR